jgi:hypothetical protein
MIRAMPETAATASNTTSRIAMSTEIRNSTRV